MEKQEMLWIANYAVKREITNEELSFCKSDKDLFDPDFLKSEEGVSIKKQIIKYMDEMKAIGKTAFYKKYKEYHLY